MVAQDRRSPTPETKLNREYKRFGMIGVAEDEEEGPTVPGFDDVSVASDGNEHGDADGTDNGNVLEDESSNEQDGGNNGGECSVRNQDAFFYFFTHKVYMQARPNVAAVAKAKAKGKATATTKVAALGAITDTSIEGNATLQVVTKSKTVLDAARLAELSQNAVGPSPKQFKDLKAVQVGKKRRILTKTPDVAGSPFKRPAAIVKRPASYHDTGFSLVPDPVEPYINWPQFDVKIPMVAERVRAKAYSMTRAYCEKKP